MPTTPENQHPGRNARAARTARLLALAAAGTLGAGLLTGCERFESASGAADKRVAEQIQQGDAERTTQRDKIPASFEKAAAEAAASDLVKARALSNLAQAELEAGTSQMQQIDMVDSRAAQFAWEVGRLTGRSVASPADSDL